MGPDQPLGDKEYANLHKSIPSSLAQAENLVAAHKAARTASAAPHHAPDIEPHGLRPALDAIAPGDSGHVGGWLVRNQGGGKYRIDTDRGHVTGGAVEIASHLEKDRRERDIDRPRGQAALARASAHNEPDALAEPERHAREQQAFAALPHGARVVSLDPKTRGRHGSIVRHEGQTLVQLDGDPAAAPTTHVEPLDPRQSWRGGARPAEAPRAEAGRLFAEPERERGPKAPPEPIVQMPPEKRKPGGAMSGEETSAFFRGPEESSRLF